MTWLRKLFHRHDWRDAFEFDSTIEVTIPGGQERVIARAVMMECVECGAMQRRPLPFNPHHA